MIFDLLIPPKGPRGRSQKKFDVARPIHVSNSHTKFGWISSDCLGGDSITDRQTDGQMDGGYNNIPSVFLKKRGDNNTNDPQKKYCLGTVIKIAYLSWK